MIKAAPSFGDVLALSNQYLSEKLKSYDINGTYRIEVSGRKTITHDCILFDKTRPAIWSIDDEYAWFTVNELPGGCDAYVCRIGDCGQLEVWNGEFESNERARKLESQLRHCFETGFYWTFRRSVGQPAIINLSYGIIAAAFAEITKGYIFSNDTAWDYDIFPASAAHFLKVYFDPQYPVLEYATWAKDCIEVIKSDCRTL